MILIDSAQYQNLQEPSRLVRKFDSIRYSVVGSASYVAVSALATSWNYSCLVSASASALGGGVSAGGMDSLFASHNKTTALVFVSQEAVTATAWMRELRITEQLDPTNYLVSFQIVRAV